MKSLTLRTGLILRISSKFKSWKWQREIKKWETAEKETAVAESIYSAVTHSNNWNGVIEDMVARKTEMETAGGNPPARSTAKKTWTAEQVQALLNEQAERNEYQNYKKFQVWHWELEKRRRDNLFQNIAAFLILAGFIIYGLYNWC